MGQGMQPDVSLRIEHGFHRLKDAATAEGMHERSDPAPRTATGNWLGAAMQATNGPGLRPDARRPAQWMERRTRQGRADGRGGVRSSVSPWQIPRPALLGLEASNVRAPGPVIGASDATGNGSGSGHRRRRKERRSAMFGMKAKDLALVAFAGGLLAVEMVGLRRRPPPRCVRWPGLRECRWFSPRPARRGWRPSRW